MYAVELRFAIGERWRAPTPDVLLRGLLRAPGGLYGHIEHVRVRRRHDCLHAVLFVTAGSAHEAGVLGGVLGTVAATAVPTVRFTGVRPWPDAGAGSHPDVAPDCRQEEAP